MTEGIERSGSLPPPLAPQEGARNLWPPSRSTVVLEDYWGEYLSNEARPVGDFRCQMSSTWKCGFARAELRPGYVTDFSNEVSLGPSLARRDTLTLHIRFRVHDRF